MSIELKKALYNISALADLGQEITSVNAFQEKMQAVLYVMTGTFLANKGAILFYDKSATKLQTLAQKGFSAADLERVSAAELRSLDKNRPCSAEGCSILPVAGAQILVPLGVRDEFIGVILLSGKMTALPYAPEELGKTKGEIKVTGT